MAYKCGECRMFIPREGHAKSCSRSSNARTASGTIGGNETARRDACDVAPGLSQTPVEEGLTLAQDTHAASPDGTQA